VSPLEPYDTSPVADWGLKVLQQCGPWQHQGSRLVLQGTCPRCKDQDGISEWLPVSVWATGLKVAADASNDDVARAVEDAHAAAENAQAAGANDAPKPTPEEYVRCQCSQPHDATKAQKGCGANGLVPVVVVS
jgi:hypothetical protein